MRQTPSVDASCLDDGDHAKVQKLLSWGGDCNAMCNGRRPLHCAVLGDSVECLKSASAKDIDVNGRDGVFQTPLHVACDIACDPDIVVVLANHHGVHIDATDAKFRRPLHRAAEEATRWPAGCSCTWARTRARRIRRANGLETTQSAWHTKLSVS